MWIVVPNPQAVIYLPLLLRTRRELRRKYDIEFYILDVTSRGLVWLTDVASSLVKKWKEAADVSEEAKRHRVQQRRKYGYNNKRWHLLICSRLKHLSQVLNS